MSDPSPNDLNHQSESRLFLRIALATFVLWCSFGLLIPICLAQFIPASSVQIYGQVGDTFGLVNSLFSGFAFFVAIWTVRLQIIEHGQSSKRYVEQERLQLEQLQIGQQTVKQQAEMREREDRLLIQNCLLELNGDVSRIMELSWVFGVRPKIYMGMGSGGVPKKKFGYGTGNPETGEHVRQLDQARAALNDDILAVKLRLGKAGQPLVEFTGKLLELSDKSVFCKPKTDLFECVKQIRAETERIGITHSATFVDEAPTAAGHQHD